MLVTVLVLLAFALVVAMLVAVYMNYSDLGLAEQTVVPDVADAKSADNNGDFDEWLGDVSPTINSRPHKNMTSASRRKKLLSLFKVQRAGVPCDRSRPDFRLCYLCSWWWVTSRSSLCSF